MSNVIQFDSIDSTLLQDYIDNFNDDNHFALVIKSAMRHGAYIAGGFARFLFNNRHEDLKDLKQKSWKIFDDFTDIDFFFSNERSIQQFLLETNDVITTQVSFTGHALNCRLVNDLFLEHIQRYKSIFQVITMPRAIGEIKDTMSNFDLYPSMIAVNLNGFIVAHDQLVLDNSKTMKVRTVYSPFTIKRLVKYALKYGYTNFDDESSKLVLDAVTNFYVDAKLGNPFSQHDYVYSEYRSTYFLSTLIKLMTSRDVLFSSFIGSDQNYQSWSNVIYKELQKRSLNSTVQDQK